MRLNASVSGAIDLPPEKYDRSFRVFVVACAVRLSLPAGGGRTMKRSTFTEEQVAYAVRQAESGTPVPDVCLQLGVS